MPNLTVKVNRDQPPIVTMVLGVTDARDESLTAAGQPVPHPVLVPTLLDSGARSTIIARNVADELRLEPLGMQEVVGVAGSLSVPGTVHRVRLTFHLAGTIPIELDSRAEVISVEDLSRLGVRMILGRDQLRKCVMIYNGPHDCCTFAV
jgi:hypothetical protein